MNFEKDPTQNLRQNNEQALQAQEELKELGVETNPENMEALTQQRNIGQHPEGYEDVLDSLDNPEELKRLMQEMNLSSIVHSEGKTVWDHAKAAIKEVEEMDISEEEKNDLKLIMLYHDLGKTEAPKTNKNIKQTEKKLKKGELFQAMIGHNKERLEDIRQGFQSNGIEGKKLEKFMTVVENHMQTSLLEQDPKKTVKLFQEFGESEEEIKEVVKLLVNVIQADGNATQRIDLNEGELDYSQNENKIELSFDEIWAKYEKGKETIEQEEGKEKEKKAEEALEKNIFGKKLSEYLINDKGIEPGPDMGRYMGEVKKIIKQHRDSDLPFEQIKEKVDKKIQEI